MTFRDDAQELLRAAQHVKSSKGDLPVNVGDLARETGWSMSTVQTVLSHVDGKGYLAGVSYSGGDGAVENIGRDTIVYFDGLTEAGRAAVEGGVE
ncbi:hypothetical protein A6A08_24660 [Nocardiopsis sp. TSRI0078]|uniref:hypothetical protein n=1 Tax=unclassified Nocardiopsis TaxID=2649073 RepID=UPI00093B8711|nr:hypothetical protein [Nocardiopsis sp. TSRI0078]OKI18539.1 hypothetical protein A6A08_24660 [Nocardiopsis sp. TSRI0078]